MIIGYSFLKNSSMPKPKPVKKVVPVEELKTSPFTEVIELERTVTPDEKLRVDHIFIKRKKINAKTKTT